MRILKLTLHKRWFDMILSGIKKEEYREHKDYWFKRLTNFFKTENLNYEFEKYDAIHFFNGGHYGKDLRNFIIECKGISEGIGKVEWGAEPRETTFIIKLGNILEKHNIDE